MPTSDQGVSNDRYALIPRTLSFLTSGEFVLLLKGDPHKRLWSGLYNGIGGHVERGESILAAARRELLEETGLDQADLHLCGVITIDTGDQPGIVVFVFRWNSASLLNLPLQPSAEGELEWVPASEVYGLPLVEDLPQLLPRVLAWNEDERPFFAHYDYDADGSLLIRFS